MDDDEIPWMDKEPGDKPSAFSQAMGELILRRIAAGETMKAITAHPLMPAYCTVFRWMQVIPGFGDAVADARRRLAAAKLAARSEAEAERARARVAALGRGERVRWWVSGQRSTYHPAWADMVLEAVETGAAISHVLDRPDMPSTKAWYRWLKTVPGLAELYAEACQRRAGRAECDRDMVIESVRPGGDIPAANKALRAIDGRRGAMTPKVYLAGALAMPATGPEGQLWAPDVDMNAAGRLRTGPDPVRRR